MTFIDRLGVRQLLLIDLVGALVSAFLLGVVLPISQALFGIPLSVLYTLAAVPVGFALLDWYSLGRSSEGKVRGLRLIALLNGGYCGLSLVLGWWHRGQLTALGWGYLTGEVLVVLALAFLEWLVADRAGF